MEVRISIIEAEVMRSGQILVLFGGKDSNFGFVVRSGGLLQGVCPGHL